MSKLTKAYNNPRLFISDMIKKRILKNGFYGKNTSSLKKKTLETHVKVTKPKHNTTLTVITDNIRLFNRTAHLIHTGEGINCYTHIDNWIGEFISSGEDFAILTRNIGLYNWTIKNYPYLNISYAKSSSDVEKVLSKLPFLKAIYYPSNTGNLIHSLRYNAYKHIFIGHGDSDKQSSAHKFFRVYDEIWVAGQAHIDRFKNAGINTSHINFVKVGRPHLKSIIKNNATLNNNKVKTITYLPTWEGTVEMTNSSSVHLSVVMLSEVQKKLDCRIIAKYHPMTGNRDITLNNLSNSLRHEFNDRSDMLDIMDKTTPIQNIIHKSDAFICDISAVVSECISSLAPVFVYIPADREITISKSNLVYSDYAYTFSNLIELDTLLTKVIIEGDDHLYERRVEALEYLISINETVNDEFIQQLKKINDGNMIENHRELIQQ